MWSLQQGTAKKFNGIGSAGQNCTKKKTEKISGYLLLELNRKQKD